MISTLPRVAFEIVQFCSAFCGRVAQSPFDTPQGRAAVLTDPQSAVFSVIADLARLSRPRPGGEPPLLDSAG